MAQTFHLETPLSEADVRQLHVRDTVFLTGRVFGIRDATQRRIFDENVEPPVDLCGYPCLHTAPNVRKVGKGYEKLCIGTTTSSRMERYSPLLIERYGVRAILGKGGLMAGSLSAMARHGAAYLAVVGGAAALQTTQIEAIDAAYWEDLFPECLWQFRVKELGPLTVAMSSHGESLYAEVAAEAKARLPEILSRMEAGGIG